MFFPTYQLNLFCLGCGGERFKILILAMCQNLQHVTFLMTVCHVVLVVQDWFTDPALLNLLLTAEMLKPSTPTHDGTNTPDDQPDFTPHMGKCRCGT